MCKAMLWEMISSSMGTETSQVRIVGCPSMKKNFLANAVMLRDLDMAIVFKSCMHFCLILSLASCSVCVEQEIVVLVWGICVDAVLVWA